MRKIKLFQFTFVMFLISIIVSCASVDSNIPKWILTPSSVYDDSEYLSAVGYGPDRVSAENAAIASITRIIKQNVKSETTSNEEFYLSENNWNVSKDISTNITTLSDIEISGVYIQDTFAIKKGKEIEYYALALVNRKETGNHYKSKVNDFSAVINEKIIEGYKNMGTFASYSVLKEAAQLAIENDYYLDILAVINPNFYKVSLPDYGNAANVEELTRQCLSKILVGFDFTGSNDRRIVNAFSKVFSQYGINITDVENSDLTYILKADVSFIPLEMTRETQNKYVRFVVNANLIEAKTGKTVLPFSVSGREAHLSEEEAIQRAIRTIEDEIDNLFVQKIEELF